MCKVQSEYALQLLVNGLCCDTRNLFTTALFIVNKPANSFAKLRQKCTHTKKVNISAQTEKRS